MHYITSGNNNEKTEPLECSSKEQVTMEFTFHENLVIVCESSLTRLVGLLLGFHVLMRVLYVQGFKGVRG
jgi:hypothetical protein